MDKNRAPKNHKVLGAIVLGWVLTAGAAQAQSAALSEITTNKATNLSVLTERISKQPNNRQRIIVTYKMPRYQAPLNASEPEKDVVLKAQNAAARDRILDAVFGSSQAVFSGPLSTEYNAVGMDYTPQILMHLTPGEINQLAAHPDITAIAADMFRRPKLDQSTSQIDMPPVWTANGLGAGRTVVIMDTGVKKDHEFFTAARIVSEGCYNFVDAPGGVSSRCPGGATATTVAGSGEDCPQTVSADCSHGTHVAGAAAGRNTNLQPGEPTQGVAPNANIIAMNVFSLVTGGANCAPNPSPCLTSSDADQITAFNRVFALRNTFNIDAVNLSLGGGTPVSTPCDGEALKPAVDLLRGAGIATIAASGNSGNDTAVESPGCISTVIAVASSLDNADTRSDFSHWGNLIDLVAPGSDIQSANYGANATTNSTYVDESGTSQATPHVAGAFAALRSLYPTATIQQILNALRTTGQNITSAGVTKPRIDMQAACASLGGGTCGATTNPVIFASILPTARGTQTDDTVTAFASITNSSATDAALGCEIALPPGVNATFGYQTVDAGNNLTGSANTPANIPASGTQSFVFSVTPTAAASTNIPLVFDCTNTAPVTTVWGLNSFAYSSVDQPNTIADMVAIASTIGNTGYIVVNGPTGLGAASVAVLNIGATENIRVSVTEQAINGTDPNMPATLQICMTDATGTCTTPYATQHNFNAVNGSSYFVSVLATGSGMVANDPANNRAHIYFHSGANVVGATSVAVRTN